LSGRAVDLHQGCTIEAHDFADASDDFKKLGATVIGVTRGNTDRLAEFSLSECHSKFATTAVSAETVKAYDTVLAMKPEWSDRTSYVIVPDGTILFVHSDLNPDQHVALTLEAVKKWRATHQ
jgi:peroxiredoxin